MSDMRGGSAPLPPSDSRPFGTPGKSFHRPLYTRMGGPSGLQDLNMDLRFRGGGVSADPGFSPPTRPLDSSFPTSATPSRIGEEAPTVAKPGKVMVATATGAAFAPMPGGAWREGPKRVSNVKATEVVHAPVVSPSPVELVCEALPSLSVGKRQPAASPTESPPPTLQHQYELEATRQSAPPVIVGQSASPVPILSVSADVSRPLNSDLQSAVRATRPVGSGSYNRNRHSAAVPVRASRLSDGSHVPSLTGEGLSVMVQPLRASRAVGGASETISSPRVDVSVEGGENRAVVGSGKESPRPPARQRAAGPTQLFDVREPEGKPARSPRSARMMKSHSASDRPPTRSKPLTEALFLDDADCTPRVAAAGSEDEMRQWDDLLPGPSLIVSPLRAAKQSASAGPPPPFIRSGGWVAAEMAEPVSAPLIVLDSRVSPLAVSGARVQGPAARPAAGVLSARTRAVAAPSATSAAASGYSHERRRRSAGAKLDSKLDPEFLSLFAGAQSP